MTCVGSGLEENSSIGGKNAVRKLFKSQYDGRTYLKIQFKTLINLIKYKIVLQAVSRRAALHGTCHNFSSIFDLGQGCGWAVQTENLKEAVEVGKKGPKVPRPHCISESDGTPLMGTAYC